MATPSRRSVPGAEHGAFFTEPTGEDPDLVASSCQGLGATLRNERPPANEVGGSGRRPSPPAQVASEPSPREKSHDLADSLQTAYRRAGRPHCVALRERPRPGPISTPPPPPHRLAVPHPRPSATSTYCFAASRARASVSPSSRRPSARNSTPRRGRGCWSTCKLAVYGGPRAQIDPAVREVGEDWPSEAETMIGMVRARYLAKSVEQVVRDGVPGDLLEAGVWRGGVCILMRGALEALGDTARFVWVADSFEGLPKPEPERYPADEGDDLWTFKELAVSLEQVQANFARYGLLDDRVRFLKGWFEDTLPSAPVSRLAVLRLDGDLYSSTTQALTALYPKLSPGGYCIIDDYGAVAGCEAAVEDYRKEHCIDDPIEQIDWTGVAWRRSREVPR